MAIIDISDEVKQLREIKRIAIDIRDTHARGSFLDVDELIRTQLGPALDALEQ